ncbi:MAG: NAD-dependent malic enzyme [Pseudomonadota bacterium]
MKDQLAREYANFKNIEKEIDRYLFLSGLQDRDETLFYRLLQEHISEMMPIVYTPVVGLACQRYSHICRERTRGVFVPYARRGDIDAILSGVPSDGVEVIVVTDGERILGLGDLGANGMGIPIGKLTLYTLCAGIHPSAALPVLLDTGTENQSLLDDPLYIGWRHGRVRGKDYDGFVEEFVQCAMKKFPGALLQWEDFSKENAGPLLEKYRDRLCTFNDDIQGTGSVALAGIIAATKAAGTKLADHRIVMLGAGSAATGISDQIVAAAVDEGIPERQARSQIWLVDKDGLVLEPLKHRYAQPKERVTGWELERPDSIMLRDTVRNVRPTILIGVSAQTGAFTKEIICDMAGAVERPIIFPLSNPNSKCEAVPADIIAWTSGKAIVATGSPFPEVSCGGRSIRIGQCNNAFVFPGIGLGLVAAKVRRVTDGMFVAAARALAGFSPALKDQDAPLYPTLDKVRDVSRAVAIAVALKAQEQGLAEKTSREELEMLIDKKMWKP